ncbi:hypothetical protein E2C01_054898 [Portunus trituberculatus]|uniref:Uncharacterized protein n=1 Tax=Portunus trituberculatus TaxID=210409 RepID=A0A5B7GT64_PORTR|nr:hypothetical protein [Portunus trituberculatus]
MTILFRVVMGETLTCAVREAQPQSQSDSCSLQHCMLWSSCRARTFSIKIRHSAFSVHSEPLLAWVMTYHTGYSDSEEVHELPDRIQ